MKIVVFSDSHRDLENMRLVLQREKPDVMIHLGDHDQDAERIGQEFTKLPIIRVRGNCDGWSDTPLTLTVVLGGVRFFLCHGHTYGVKGSYMRAFYAAEENKADILCFGHTHEAYLDDSDPRITVLNPGAVGYGWQPSYGLIKISGGRMQVKIKSVTEE